MGEYVFFQVVMLSSVTELHAYIDPGQLTTEVGGTQDYNHDSWISHRTVRMSTYLDFLLTGLSESANVSLQAIEAFALMVKTIAQTLQAFGTELAETELPNDAEATTNLLQAHTCKKEQMKVSDASRQSSRTNAYRVRKKRLIPLPGGPAGGALSRKASTGHHQRASSGGSRIQYDA